MVKTAVILCGGQGTRLRPYTIIIPKPLMPLGNSSILEIIVKQLIKFNFDRLIFAVNYRSDLIKAYFQDGSKFGIEISYVDEVEPLGTIGPLRNIKDLPAKFMVMNGDILTDLNYDYYLSSFDPNQEFACVATYKKSYQVDFGVLEFNQEGLLYNFIEKPKNEIYVSMGIYFFSPQIFDLIPAVGSFGFDQLMLSALKNNLNVKCPQHQGFWLDIGRHEDYEYAQDNWNRISQLYEQ